MSVASPTPCAKKNTIQIFETSRAIYQGRVNSDMLMCNVYDAFVDEKSRDHNCIGCNLQDLSEQIGRFLENAVLSNPEYKPEHTVSLYLFLLNTLWERITDIFDVIGVPDAYRARHFGPLLRVRRWANFFKHPKEFAWIVHHPQFVFEDSQELTDVKKKSADHLFVDDEFVKKFYSCERVKGLRTQLLKSRDRVVVILPDLADLTNQVCDCVCTFVTMITDNPVYQEMLKDDSTIEGFFQTQCEALSEQEA